MSDPGKDPTSATSVEVRSGPDILSAIRQTVAGADDVLMCVAFARAAGVNLITPQLPRGSRLLVTTVFGSTTAQGIDVAARAGATVRALNPPGGTYHPKVYLGRHGTQVRAVVGSANLTGGLVTNIEAATVMHGPAEARPLEGLWALAESWWTDPLAAPLHTTSPGVAQELIEPDLYALVRELLRTTDTVATVSDGKRNRIIELAEHAIFVETDRSRSPQPVPAWMLNVAWEHLRRTGSLSNAHLLADDGLNVKRSSFVCALLAALPVVDVVSRRPIILRRAGWVS